MLRGGQAAYSPGCPDRDSSLSLDLSAWCLCSELLQALALSVALRQATHLPGCCWLLLASLQHGLKCCSLAHTRG